MTYGTGGRWGQWSAGGGSSLELIDPHANHRLAANWADSDETQKSVWTNIETTGVLDNGANYESSIAYAQIGCWMWANVSWTTSRWITGAINYVSNSTFESGTTGWSFQGDMRVRAWRTPVIPAAHSLHIRSSDRVWTGDNSCQVALNANSLAQRSDRDVAIQGALVAWLAGSVAAFEWQLAGSRRRDCRCRPISVRPECPTASR